MTDDAGLEELRAASESGDSASVSRLLGLSSVLANINAPDSGYFGGTALSYASERGHGVVVALLLEANASPGSPDRSGFGPLHLAAQHGHKGAVRALLEAKAPPDAKDNQHATPLHFAARQGHADAAKLLLAHSASVGLVGGERRTTALWQAVERGHSSVALLLLDAGADPSAKDTAQHETSVHLAARGGDLDTMTAILRCAGGSVAATSILTEARSRQSSTPLHLAAQTVPSFLDASNKS